MAFILNRRMLIRLQQYNDGGYLPEDIDTYANYGHLSLIRYHNNKSCSVWAMNNAAKKGYLHIVKWLHYNHSEGCTKSAIDMASSYGHIDIVRFLCENRTEGCTNCAIILALQHNHTNVIKFLTEHYSKFAKFV